MPCFLYWMVSLHRSGFREIWEITRLICKKVLVLVPQKNLMGEDVIAQGIGGEGATLKARWDGQF